MDLVQCPLRMLHQNLSKYLRSKFCIATVGTGVPTVRLIKTPQDRYHKKVTYVRRCSFLAKRQEVTCVWKVFISCWTARNGTKEALQGSALASPISTPFYLRMNGVGIMHIKNEMSKGVTTFGLWVLDCVVTFHRYGEANGYHHTL